MACTLTKSVPAPNAISSSGHDEGWRGLDTWFTGKKVDRNTHFLDISVPGVNPNTAAVVHPYGETNTGLPAPLTPEHGVPVSTQGDPKVPESTTSLWVGTEQHTDHSPLSYHSIVNGTACPQVAGTVNSLGCTRSPCLRQGHYRCPLASLHMSLPQDIWGATGLACILLLPGFCCVTICQQLSLSGPPKFQSMLEDTVETAQ